MCTQLYTSKQAGCLFGRPCMLALYVVAYNAMLLVHAGYNGVVCVPFWGESTTIDVDDMQCRWLAASRSAVQVLVLR